MQRRGFVWVRLQILLLLVRLQYLVRRLLIADAARRLTPAWAVTWTMRMKEVCQQQSGPVLVLGCLLWRSLQSLEGFGIQGDAGRIRAWQARRMGIQRAR